MSIYFYPSLVLAGGLGALLRYWLSKVTIGGSWAWLPAGTLLANGLGCLLIGLLSGLFLQRWEVNPELQKVVLSGFLGGFTTFSAFSLETVAMLEQGEGVRAFVYVAASVIVSVSLCLVGLWLARQSFI